MDEARTVKPLHPSCSQCGRPAIELVNDVPLCVACHYQFFVAKTLQLRNAAIGLNYASAEMDSITGFRLSNPMQVPDIPKGPIILNNIRVDNSVVGSINTGSVQAIDVSITVLKEAGNKEASAALQTLAEVIASATTLTPADRNMMLDQVAYLSEQAVAAAKDRSPGMIKAAFSSITQAAGTVAAVASAWQAAEPLLRSLFGC